MTFGFKILSPFFLKSTLTPSMVYITLDCSFGLVLMEPVFDGFDGFSNN